MNRVFVAVAVLVAATACGETKSPSAPTPPAAPAPAPAPNPTPNPSTWSLTGKVTENPPTETQVIGGATVTIVDGPNAGKSTQTDAAGSYSFTNLTQATINVDATAPGYQKKTANVVLNANETVMFQLAPVLKSIDDQVNDTVSAASPACDSADPASRLPCFKYLIGAHNGGSVDAVLTWADAAGNTAAGGTLGMELVKEPGTGAADRIATATTTAGRAQITSTIPGGALYSIRVLYRGGSAPQPFTLKITRPN